MGSEMKNGLVESVDGAGGEAGYRARSKGMSASRARRRRRETYIEGWDPTLPYR